MTIRNKLQSLIRLSLSVCLLTAFAACSNETAVGEDNPDVPGQLVTMRLQIGTADAGRKAVPRTKAEGDTETKDGELIHSLKVFIVDNNGNVEKEVPFTFEADDLSLMNDGKLEVCTSDEFTITTGAKTIYAFANCEGCESWGTEGGKPQLPTTISWSKPSDPLSWTPGGQNGFIPMSGISSITINTNTKTASVELVRLLSKIQLSFRNKTKDDITVNSWSIGKFNSKINLLNNADILGTEAGWPVDGEEIKLEANGQLNDPQTFYVSESAMLGGFEVSVTRGGESETKRTARTEIPRNHVWPLEIVFSDYKLRMKIEGNNPPIGGYPAATTSTLGDDLTCVIYGGGSFTLTPTLIDKDGNVVDGVQWSVLLNQGNNLIIDGPTVEDNKIIKGRMAGAATEGTSYSFKLIAAKDSQGEITSFEVTLKFDEIFNNKD